MATTRPSFRTLTLGLIAALLGGAVFAMPATRAFAASTDLSVSTGANHTCAVNADGTLWCWGFAGPDYDLGYLGDGTNYGSELPVQVGTDTDWSRVSVGYATTCAIKTDGRLFCFGWNGSGQLGTGADQVGIDELSPVQIGIATDWAAVGVGTSSACAVTTDGALSCWGWNSSGQLGNGTTVDQYEPALVGSGYASVSVGANHACAITTADALLCWGGNRFGQVGNGGDAIHYTTPVAIDGAFAVVSAGVSFTCAITTDGRLGCWGSNLYGQVASETALGSETVGVTTPTYYLDETDWSSVSAGDQYVCATKTSGDLFCWGRNRTGELTDGTPDELPHPVPVQITGTLSDPATDAPVDREPVGAARVDLLGMVRLPMIAATTASPDWTVVSAARHGCGVVDDGTIACWGDNASGALGTGGRTDVSRPVGISLTATPAAPMAVVSPVIEGVLAVGRTLTASSGDWVGRTTPVYTYVWYRCINDGAATPVVPDRCTLIKGATGSSYTTVAADAKRRLRVKVTATNVAGASSTVSAASAAVATPVANSGRPTISGTATVNRDLTARRGSWSGTGPISYAYQWYACTSRVRVSSAMLSAGCEAIDGATGSTYRVVSANRRSYLVVGVTATTAVNAATQYSASTNAVR